MNTTGTGRVSKDVWVGADRVETTGDLLLQMQQVVARYGPGKPVYFAVGNGMVGRRLDAIGECWQAENKGTDPAECDGVFFMIQAKGVEGWSEQQRGEEKEVR